MELDDIINQILEMIKYNIHILYEKDKDSFPGIRRFVNNKTNYVDKLPYWTIVYFLEEVLGDLINCEQFYDNENDCILIPL